MTLKWRILVMSGVLLCASRVIVGEVAQFGVLVLDDVNGKPLTGVEVRATFRNNNGWKAWTESASKYRDYKTTDENGFCILSGKTNIGQGGCSVIRPPSGYYCGVGGIFQFNYMNILGIWQPDNLVATIRLQRVEHPVPLSVKRVGDYINKSKVGYVDGTNSVLKYDFLIGDYLPPDGKGVVADMIIDSKRTYFEKENDTKWSLYFYDYANVISMPGKGNGLIPQIIRPADGIWLRTAPETGYQSSINIACGQKKVKQFSYFTGENYSESNPKRSYYFRIRSKYDEKGNLVEAYYGKIYEDFKIGFYHKRECSFEFLYYLNPNPLDRNLEWDCKTNLCPTPGRNFRFKP